MSLQQCSSVELNVELEPHTISKRGNAFHRAPTSLDDKYKIEAVVLSEIGARATSTTRTNAAGVR